MNDESLNKSEAITLLLKSALEFNANVIEFASLISCVQLDEKAFKKAKRDFETMNKKYEKRIKSILDQTV